MKQIQLTLFLTFLAITLSACSLTPLAQVPATATPTSWSPAPATPTSPQLLLHTQNATNVHLGPGKTYGISFTLPANTKVTVIGRNLDSTWWVVPDTDNAGHGWVSASETEIFGSTDSLPIWAAPTLTPTPFFPSIGKTSPGTGNTCEVTHPGMSGPIYVYAGPNKQNFPIVAELGLNRWVSVIDQENSDWYQVLDDTGVTGWVPVKEVAHNGYCQTVGDPDVLTLIENSGAPPSDQCIAHRPGQFPPPNVYFGPDREFALIAKLGNWAEVLKAKTGWYLISIGPEDVGWVSAEDIDLSGPCSSL